MTVRPELDDKEFDWMQKLDKEINKAWNNLNFWEKNFMEDMLARFHQYGRNTMISLKQWEAITKISEKII
jgi:hypothetical protein